MASASIIPYPPASRWGGEEGRAIDLADEPDFDLGQLRVAPSTRELFAPGGREVLEPRVMMVLAELARHRGHTVSRDNLVATCWDGLVVGDDAINRVIGKLRKLAAASGAFKIETITKVGYRLTECSPSAPSHTGPYRGLEPAGATAAELPVPDQPPPGAGPAVLRLAVAALVAVGLLAAASWQMRGGTDAPPLRPAAAVPVDPVAAALLERGRAAIAEHSPVRVAQGVAQLQEATQRAPDSAEAWGVLARGYAAQYFRTPPEDQPALVRRAEAAITRALALDPEQRDAHAARVGFSTPYGRWLAHERLERLAFEKSGGGGTYPRFLQFVGRSTEALPLTERAVLANPGALHPQVGRASALFAAGRIDEADRATADLVRLWPQNYLAWFNRAYFLMYTGRAREAVAFVENRNGWPQDIPPAELATTGQMARAIASGDKAEADAVIAHYDVLAKQGQGYIENAIRISAALGRPDDAFRFARLLYLSPASRLPRERFVNQQNYAIGNDRHTDLLFRPPMDRLHADPRFLALLTEMGLVAYWRDSGTTPDFCRRLVEPCRRAGIPVKG